MSKEIIEKAGKIIQTHTGKNAAEGSEPYCVLALIDLEGYPTASAITPAQAEGIEKISMCTGLSSNKAERVRKCNRAGICFSSLEYNITLTGTIEIITDPKVKKEYDTLEAKYALIESIILARKESYTKRIISIIRHYTS